uniref:NADH dehydrogenase subunit 2 n=1 Tax=Adelges cooleyi TaxID=133065 RepID=UPI0025A9706D|nr:NADH dehydrogenase subunit 2 [Adelges cooleyi]WIW75853.1 NADH dehydrogenase subunit 2 [Adelges cooleyi]
MNLNLTKMMFFMFLTFSTIMSISSMNWMSMWMGLELNLFSIIPIMNMKSSIYSLESTMKYFLIQAFSSIILLMMLTFKSFFFLLNLNMMIIIPLMIKLSIMPFHLWLPSMIEGLKWSTCFIMFTWQKITPMILISYLNLNKNLLMLLISLLMINTIFGINQNSIRKIMAMSSINNTSWMLIAILINEKLWINYFLIYSYINILMIMIFYKYNINYINQMKLFNMNYLLKLNLMMIMFSMMGLPPMLGFMMKWMLIQNLIYMNLYFILMILILMTIMNLMFYMKMCYFMLFNFNLFNKWFLKNKKMNSFYSIFWINFLMMIMNYFYLF